MRLIVYLIFLFIFSKQSWGQSYVNDWKDFKSNIWNLDFEKSIGSVFGVRTAGELTFVNKMDTSLKISFRVIALADRDSIFEKKLQYYFHMQSCRPVSVYSKSISSFNLKNFGYIYMTCQPNKRPAECEELSDHILRVRQNKNSK